MEKINYTIKDLAKDLSEYIYDKQKANIFCLLESQIETEQKLKACKSIANGSLKSISGMLELQLNKILTIKDWQVEISKECNTCREKCSNNKYCIDDNYKYWKIDLSILHK